MLILLYFVSFITFANASELSFNPELIGVWEGYSHPQNTLKSKMKEKEKIKLIVHKPIFIPGNNYTVDLTVNGG